MKRFILSALAGGLLFGCGHEINRPALDPATLQHLVAYVEQHHQTPEEFVLSQFDEHDIVFVGEWHRIKHDVALVRELIPMLYEHGIYNLGIEFADSDDQPKIDSLLTGDTYNEALARQIQFHQWPFWGYQDYIDLYRAAWELNHNLKPDQPKFRIVGLNALQDWSHVWTEADREDPDIMKRVWPEGPSDSHMAGVILREFVQKNQKALIYSGMYHAFTRFHQPLYDLAKDSLLGMNHSRMGNIVYDSIGNRCMTICLHAPWPAATGYDHAVYAADGYIDSLIALLPADKRRAGFAVYGTPFEDLPGSTSFWHYGHPDFTLKDYCDGYIIQKPLKEYEGVAVVQGFINESNRLTAIAQSANPKWKDSSETVEDLQASLARDADIQRMFKTMIKDY